MSSHHLSEDTVLAVVHKPGRSAPGCPLVLELCGPLGTAGAESVAARLAERHRAYSVTVGDDDGGRHRLSLLPTGPGEARPQPLTAELLADVLALLPGVEGIVPVTGHQRELILAAAAGAPGRHVEQLFWNWSGPLDTSRFAMAWQSLVDREAVLRASFDWTAAPRLLLHDRAEIEVVRHAHSTLTWSDLVKRDRARGFDLHRPGLLRATLLDAPPGTAAQDWTAHTWQPQDRLPPERAPVRVLLTYHRALLDERGVHLLLREFFRAYAGGGVLPGGERRPDIRDHARWLARQDTTTAHAFWPTTTPTTTPAPATAPVSAAAVRPGRPGSPTGHTGPGRLQRRLRPPQTARLRSWAAMRGVGESSALHVVWALLLYRAAGATGPLPVTFHVHLSGRDVPMQGAAGIPGLLGNPLPMTVTVDPAAPLADLLHQMRDTAFDLIAHAWLPADRIRALDGRDQDGEPADTVVVFDSRPELPEALLAELREMGVQVDAPQSVSGDTTLPFTLVAQHSPEGGLLLTGLYDRAALADGDASATLSQCVQLLRSLPDHRDPQCTVAQVLEPLRTCDVPRAAPRSPAPRGLALAELRPGEPLSDVICLIAVPGVPPGAYEALARDHQGPERIVALRMEGPAGDVSVSVLREMLAPDRRLVLGGCGPGGSAAHEIARRAASGPGTGPDADGEVAVVMTGVGGTAASARALARGLRSVQTKDT
ncbi:condensation domain-containing protein [Streptomyces sp. NPDC086787]|uniref:condensation domain-containing protein n=1 Tax=Streptomyces sp. NPDC086787 TaxID=3365759 RepID=UPI0037F580A0